MAATRMSIACPDCGTANTPIIIVGKGYLALHRQRRCSACNNIFKTTEVVTETLPRIVLESGHARVQRDPNTPVAGIRLPLFGGLTA